MLKAAQIIAAVATVALFLSVAGISYLSSPLSGNPSEQQSVAQTQDGNQTEEKHTLRGFTHFLFPDAIAFFTFWLALATVILGIVAVVQIGYLRRAESIATANAEATKRSAQTARDTLIASNRPWVSLEISIGGPLAHGAAGWDAGVRWHIPLRYRARNIGKSPATDVSFFAKILPFTLPHWPLDAIEDGVPQGAPIPGTEISGELESVCQFPEAMSQKRMGWGQITFPDEVAAAPEFVLNGNPQLFEDAKTNPGYSGQFLVVTCITYGSTLSKDAYRTAKAFLLFKSAGGGPRIDLNGEGIDQANLGFVLSPTNGSYAN